jgi:hypothetical protein
MRTTIRTKCSKTLEISNSVACRSSIETNVSSAYCRLVTSQRQAPMGPPQRLWPGFLSLVECIRRRRTSTDNGRDRLPADWRASLPWSRRSSIRRLCCTQSCRVRHHEEKAGRGGNPRPVFENLAGAQNIAAIGKERRPGIHRIECSELLDIGVGYLDRVHRSYPVDDFTAGRRRQRTFVGLICKRRGQQSGRIHAFKGILLTGLLRKKQPPGWRRSYWELQAQGKRPIRQARPFRRACGRNAPPSGRTRAQGLSRLSG